MRQLFLIMFFVGMGCYGQTPVLSLYDDEYGAINGAYYKDTHNDFNNYIGTWKYTNGTTSLTITLQKKTMVPHTYGQKNIFEDVIVGEYKYVLNGTELINTLPQLTLNFPDVINYNIVGNAIIAPGTGYCYDCGPNDRKIVLIFSDPNRYIEAMSLK